MMFLIQANKTMKKNISLIMFFAITSATFGTLIDHFRGWDDLIDESPDIVIARCTATPHFTPPGVTPKIVVENGGVTSDIEVISVLKGKTKPGLSKLGSFYSPYQGELFVIFSSSVLMFGTNLCYSANEGYKIIPLNSDFQIGNLNGKTLDEQIQLILKSRLKDLDEEIARDNEEKERLKQGLENENITNGISINATR